MKKPPVPGSPSGPNLRLPGLMKICWFVVAVQLGGGLAAIAIGAAVIFEFKARSAHARVIENRLRTWKAEHRLSDWQVDQLRQLELQFYGKGGFFAQAPPTEEERADHRRQISLALRSGSAAGATPAELTTGP